MSLANRPGRSFRILMTEPLILAELLGVQPEDLRGAPVTERLRALDDDQYRLLVADWALERYRLVYGDLTGEEFPALRHLNGEPLPNSPQEFAAATPRQQSQLIDALYRFDLMAGLAHPTQEARQDYVAAAPLQNEKWVLINALISYAYRMPWDEAQLLFNGYYDRAMSNFERSADNPEVLPEYRMLHNTASHSKKIFIVIGEWREEALRLAERCFPRWPELARRIHAFCNAQMEIAQVHDYSDYYGEAIYADVSARAIREAMGKTPDELGLDPKINLAVAGNRKFVTPETMIRFDGLVARREAEVFEEGLAQTLAQLRRDYGGALPETALEELEFEVRSAYAKVHHSPPYEHDLHKWVDHLQTSWDILNANRKVEKIATGMLHRQGWNSSDKGWTQALLSAARSLNARLMRDPEATDVDFKVSYLTTYYQRAHAAIEEELETSVHDRVDVAMLWVMDVSANLVMNQHLAKFSHMMKARSPIKGKYRKSVPFPELMKGRTHDQIAADQEIVGYTDCMTVGALAQVEPEVRAHMLCHMGYDPCHPVMPLADDPQVFGVRIGLWER